MSQVTVRPARQEDLLWLHSMLHEQRAYYEQQNLRHSIVFVAEYEGEIVGFSAARVMWQIEPVLLDSFFVKTAPPHARKRATYLLIRDLDAWLGDRSKNLSGIYSYFCTIRGRIMQKLAVSFGMLRVYRRSQFFGKDL